MTDVRVGSLFDGELAVANSCYTGIVLDPDHDAGRRLRVVPEGKLVPDVGDPAPSREVKFLHDQFAALASGQFPCIGAKA
ncbi:MAG TPA: hypothetical protein VF743_12430, partial [Acidimicrobiales bacterium]